jgi:xanthine dehydrogenase accessory factor
MTDIFEEIVRLRREGIPAALATIVGTKGSTPGRETMRLLVRHDGTFVGTVGGGCLEAEVYETAKDVIRDEKPATLSFKLTEFESPDNGLLCGGEVTIFIEPLTTPTLVIFGGGHVSKALAHVASMCGFRIEICEDRESYATSERFPECGAFHVGEYRELAQQIPITEVTYLCVVTRGHKGDGEVLAGLCHRDEPIKYLGMIGSRTKRAVLFRKLVEDEHVRPEWLEQIRSPVGLDIGARSHEEIAVAVVAEMIQVRRGAKPLWPEGQKPKPRPLPRSAAKSEEAR